MDLTTKDRKAFAVPGHMLLVLIILGDLKENTDRDRLQLAITNPTAIG